MGNRRLGRDSTKRMLAASAFVAFTAGLLLHFLHLAQHEIGEMSPLLHWLRDSAMAWPVTFIVFVVVGEWVRGALQRAAVAPTEPLGRVVWATAIGIAYAAALIPGSLVHGMAFGAEHGDVNPLIHGVWDAAAALPFAVIIITGWAFLVGLPFERGLSTPEARAAVARLACVPPRLRRRLSGFYLGRSREARSLRRSAIVAMSFSLVFSLMPLIGGTLGAPGFDLADAEASPAPVPECTSGNADRVYDVAAINTVIPFNRWGDVNRHGQMFALQQDKEAYKYWAFPLETNPLDDPAGNRRLRPRPLVLRANEGECIRVNFTNELGVFAPVPPRVGTAAS